MAEPRQEPRQLRVSPLESERALIKLLAKGWNDSEAGIIMRGFRKALPDLMTEFEQMQRLQGEKPEAPEKDGRAALFILALAGKKKIDVIDLQKLADDLDLPSEALAEILKNCSVKNRGKTNVKNS